MLVLFMSFVVLSGTVRAQAAAPVDTLIDFGGYRVHCRIHRGTVPMTILMESGGGATLANWGGLDSVLARRTHAVG